MNARYFTRILLLTAALVFPLGMLGRLSTVHTLANTYLFEIIWAIWVVISLRQALRSPTVHTQLWYSALLLLTVTAASATLHTFSYALPSQLVATLYALRLIMYVLGIATAASLHTHMPDAARMLRYIVVAVVVGCIVQIVLLPDLAGLKSMGWDPHRYRVVGAFLDSSVMAAVLGLCLFYSVSDARLRARRLILVVLVGLLLLTYSRGAYLAAFVASFSLMSSTRALRIIGFVVVLSALALFVLPKPQGEGGKLLRTSTIDSRVQDLREGYRIWLAHPVLGVGYNHIRDVKSSGYLMRQEVEGFDHAGASFHNSYLILAVTLGTIGLVVMLGFLVTLWTSAAFMRPYLLFIATFSLTDNILLLPPVLFLMSLLLLAGDRSVQKARKQTTSQD